MINGSQAAMTQDSAEKKLDERLDIAFILFLRFVSLALLAVGLYIWSRILGFHGADIEAIFKNNNIDGVVHVVLSVALPILSIGLWLGLSWGLILWWMIGFGLLLADVFIGAVGSEAYGLGVILCLSLVAYYAAIVARRVFFSSKKRPVMQTELD